jgi:hypothetical protein
MAEHEKPVKKPGDISRKPRIIKTDSKTASERSRDVESASLSIGETPFRPPAEKHAAMLSNAESSEERANLAMQLQQTYGNRYVQRLMRSMKIQAKLTVNAPNDPYEQEADRVADVVTKAPTVAVQKQAPEEDENPKLQAKIITAPLQREEIPEDEGKELQKKEISSLQLETSEDEDETANLTAQRQAENIEDEEEGERVAQTKREGNGVPDVTDNLEQRIKSAQVGGTSLPDAVRNSLEPQFGQDFSGVRVHNDAEAGKLSRELSAEAFTTGHDVFFGDGRYQPETDRGKKLLAHELTHVVQQGSAATVSKEMMETQEEASTSPFKAGVTHDDKKFEGKTYLLARLVQEENDLIGSKNEKFNQTLEEEANRVAERAMNGVNFSVTKRQTEEPKRKHMLPGQRQ